MKKLFSFFLAMIVYVVANAAYPNLQDITLTNSRGETLDFYADRYNKVVYHAPGANISRGGTFYLGRTISSASGNTEAEFSIELPMSYGMKKLSGTIYYRNSDGYVYNVTLEGSMYKSSSRSVVPRRR
ncbi:MAG: hypothetical protein J1E63_01325 [Muribaculaceae bacterium]|nr:hypothetical protein [Muribaculaceae bacterium]